jgi:hypothetical protein
MDGDWYHQTVLKLDPSTTTNETNPFINFIIPIKMYVDKTGCVSNERFSLGPVMFSTTILKNQFNQKSSSIFFLGTSPTPEMYHQQRKPRQTKH